MRCIKALVTTSLIASSLLMASSASASGYEIWNGLAWVKTGDVVFTGPTRIVVSGIPIPCNTTFIVGITNGAASVYAANFSGNSTCISFNPNLPWTITAPVAQLPGDYGVKMNILINLTIPAPWTVCVGSVPSVLTNANPNGGASFNKLTFRTLIVRCQVETDGSVYPYAMVSSRPVRAYFP